MFWKLSLQDYGLTDQIILTNSILMYIFILEDHILLSQGVANDWIEPCKVLSTMCEDSCPTCIFIKLNYLYQFNMSFSHIEVPHKSLPYHRLHAQHNPRQLRRWETDARGPESAILKLRLTWETFSSWETGGETGGIPRHSYQSSPPMSSITNNSQHITRQRWELIKKSTLSTPNI